MPVSLIVGASHGRIGAGVIADGRRAAEGGTIAAHTRRLVMCEGSRTRLHDVRFDQLVDVVV